tara:strand:- start:55 stop:216 length:162 start_codon:yes stop_codon:yes gene_type:complete
MTKEYEIRYINKQGETVTDSVMAADVRNAIKIATEKFSESNRIIYAAPYSVDT